ncbi:alpha/beta fold hydrolase [Geodermatophilus obscurus]|uniref:Alpha/beta hydrolase fold protein n=1 Tax=Geodermatophilus obscurus (strain ATCC 25078 / DSM 43160 / JCM 3152 / CCUG 61914 / KCC A-0152 / KCTC 9177 / NBRC 13315 / NRRL B-3577 / G-20) TaxID=526225 RepID=D2S7N1_GEOOG|nr:alpha/beta hydrolase [Geodermatophilus obscurus]ADB75490.1 alpha/beta hydrolase fold protein [Geodermatophilus obscurus DSM 43160]
MSLPPALTSPGTPVAWPPGAVFATTDLDGPVRHLDLGGPAGAPAVLCVHGLGGSALNWGLLAPFLSGSHRVLAVDLFGHGGSGVPTGSRPDAVTADRRLLDRFVREVVGEPVVLLGHSMGGVLAVLQAAAAPETIRRLVLLSPPVPGTAGRLDLAIAAKLAFLRLPGVAGAVARQLAALPSEQVVDRQLRQATPHLHRIPADGIAAAVAQTRERAARTDAAAGQAEQWAALLGTMALLARPRAWRRTLAGVAVPTLWLHGADDPLAQVDRARALAATRPDWTFEARSGVGHLPALEDPAWTADRILAGDGPGSR